MRPFESPSFRFSLRATRRVRRAGAVTAGGAVLLAATSAFAFAEYGAQFPNLTAAGGCDGMCHATGYDQSPLYIDFAASGSTWNATFASKDSDGDGFSNGWELQDPKGTWVPGTSDPGNAAAVSSPALANSLPPLPVAVDPPSITHSESPGANGSEGFAVKNVGSPGAVSFDYTLSTDQTWMAPSVSSGSGLPPQMQNLLDLIFATNSLAPGTYMGHLTVSIAGIRADRIPTVPVSLNTPEPDAALGGAAAVLALALGAVRVARRPRGDRVRSAVPHR